MGYGSKELALGTGTTEPKPNKAGAGRMPSKMGSDGHHELMHGALSEGERMDLPDADFAAVYTSMIKKNGRTQRVKVRKYPIHDANHVRDAMARFGQEKPPLPPAVAARAKARIASAAKRHGIDAATDPAEAARQGKHDTVVD